MTEIDKNLYAIPNEIVKANQDAFIEAEVWPPLNAFPGTEAQLEDLLVKNPGVLPEGLRLWGRQKRIGKRKWDLIGVDRNGRLSVLELKREEPDDCSVGQLLYYVAAIEEMNDEELVEYLTRIWGGPGFPEMQEYFNTRELDKVGESDEFGQINFTTWYNEQEFESTAFLLRPIRLFLVGVGPDPETSVVVKYLNSNGIDISLVNINVNHSESYLIFKAETVVEPPQNPMTSQARQAEIETVSQVKLQETLDNNIDMRKKEWPELEQLWDPIKKMFHEAFTPNGKTKKYKTTADGRARDTLNKDGLGFSRGYRWSFGGFSAPGPFPGCSGSSFRPSGAS